MMSRIATLLLCAVVGFAPFALGSNRPLPWAYNAFLTGTVCIIVAATLLARGTRPPLRFKPALPSLVLFGIALAWAMLQVVDLGSSSVAHPNWSVLANALGDNVSGHISVNPHSTFISMTRLLTSCAVFLSAFVLAREPENATILLRGFMVFAGLYAAYGLFRWASVSDDIIWFNGGPTTVLSSTFINRNSAATYFGLASCVSFVLVLRRLSRLLVELEEDGSQRLMIESLLRSVTGVLGFELMGFVLFFTALLLTQSRAGVAATISAMVAGFVLHILRRRRSKSGMLTAVLLALVIATSFAVFEMSGAKVTERLLEHRIETDERAGLLQATGLALSDNVLAGTGLGTFKDIYPLYRSSADVSGLVWDRAHNDYLEALLGLGIPAGFALILSIFLLVLRCLKGVFERRRNGHFPLVGFLAGTVVGLHAFVDFSLQIQAVTMSFALLLGIGTRQSVSDKI